MSILFGVMTYAVMSGFTGFSDIELIQIQRSRIAYDILLQKFHNSFKIHTNLETIMEYLKINIFKDS